MSDSTKKTLVYMCFGLFVYEVLLTAVMGLYAWRTGKEFLPLLLGMVSGTVLALGILYDIGRSTEEGLEGGDFSYAQRKTVIHAFLRKAVLIVVVVIFWNSRYVNVLGLVFAVLGLKPGAYLYPVAQKIFRKRRKYEPADFDQ